MSLYCFYQLEPATQWLPALATERQNIIRDARPALISVLDVDNSFSDENVDKAALRYQGPLYIDMDGDENEREEVISAAKELMNKFVAMGIDANTIKVFLSGKKGVHLEIDQRIFMSKLPPQGLKFLPQIYKEIVFGFGINFVDMRVYSAGRGRQWRCENIERENHKYKVRISAAELFELNAERYDNLCSAPRHAIPTLPPVFNANLAMLFAVAKDKIEAAKAKVAKRKLGSADGEKLRAKFGTDWPVIVQDVLNGTAADSGAGWNRVSLQCAIITAALGKTEAELLEAAQGLCESHKSDSQRYATPSRRRRDLASMLGYVSDSDFEFSVGGFLSIVAKEHRANHDLQFGDMQPTEKVVDESTGEIVDAGEELEHWAVRFDRNGIFCKNDYGEFKQVSHLGLAKPIMILDSDGCVIAYEIDVFADGKFSRRQKLPNAALQSCSNFNAWSMDAAGAPFRSTDMSLKHLADVLRLKAKKVNEIKYIVNREGIDVILRPGGTKSSDGDDYDIVWVTTRDGVRTTSEINYHFSPAHVDKAGLADTDLFRADALTVADGDQIEKLFAVSTEATVGKILGWMCSAFFCQHIRVTLRQYPVLQVYGQSGAGKTTLVELFSRLHYHRKLPRMLASSGGTMFPLHVAVATSASIPTALDETKSREMTKHQRDAIFTLLRNSYTGAAIQRGALTTDKASKGLTIVDYGTGCPIVIMGEGIEMQSAILDRCVVVPMSKEDKIGRRNAIHDLTDDSLFFGRIGKTLALTALSKKPDEIATIVKSYKRKIERELPEDKIDDASRPIFNFAVVFTGLHMLDAALRGVFGERFTRKIASMQDNMLNNILQFIPKNLSEASRVLDSFAMLSRNRDALYGLSEGVDYTIDKKKHTIDIKMVQAFHKYVRYQRSLQMEVLYDSDSAFLAAMSIYGGLVTRVCSDNTVLFDSPRAHVYRFNSAFLTKEGVDAFGNVM